MKGFKKRRFTVLFLFLFFNISLLLVSFFYSHLVENSISKGEEIFACAFKNTFNMYCPGCGGSRSLVSLLHFDLFKSLVLYPPLWVMIIFIIDIDARAVFSIIKDSISYIKSFRLNSIIIIPVSILLNFLLKNLLLFFGIDLIGDFLM